MSCDCETEGGKYGECKQESELVGGAMSVLNNETDKNEKNEKKENSNPHKSMIDKILSSKAKHIHKLKQIAKYNLGKRTIMNMDNVDLLDDRENPLVKGVLKDISSVKNKHDLVDMIENDFDILNEQNEPNSVFLDILDDLCSTVSPFLPYRL